MSAKPIEVLLVEDNPGDARLAHEALADCKLRLNIREVRDGEAAMASYGARASSATRVARILSSWT